MLNRIDSCHSSKRVIRDKNCLEIDQISDKLLETRGE